MICDMCGEIKCQSAHPIGGCVGMYIDAMPGE